MPTDEAAEAFLAKDLSNLDFAKFKPLRFRPKNKREAAEPASKPHRPKPG